MYYATSMRGVPHEPQTQLRMGAPPRAALATTLYPAPSGAGAINDGRRPMTMTNLDTLKRRRAEARTRHDADVSTLARGRQQLAAAQGAIDKLAHEDAEAVSRHARRLEQHARDGGKPGAVPSLVPSDRHLAAQVSAQRTYAAAGQMVAALEVAEHESAEALRVAEAAVHQAAAEALIAEVLRRDVPRLEALRTEVAALELSLRALSGVLPNIPAAISLAASDDLNVSVSELRSRGDINTSVAELSGRVTRGAEQASEWRQRLEQLESGDGGDDTAAEVAA